MLVRTEISSIKKATKGFKVRILRNLFEKKLIWSFIIGVNVSLFFHFSPYILILPPFVPKSINAFHFDHFR